MMKKQILLAMLSTILILRLNAHPGMSPYAYCAGNPVIMVDPDGRDYTIDIDDKTQTITISATYYTTDQDAASAQKAADFWNNQSGKFIYQVTNKTDAADVKNYTVNFNLKVVAVGTPTGNNKDGKEKILRNPTVSLDISGNTFTILSDSEMTDLTNENTNGGTYQGKYIRVRESKKDSPSSPHEIGHSLGLDHNETGLMAPSETNPYRSETVRKDDINKMIQYPLKGKVNSGKSTDGKTTDTGAGKLSPNSSKIDLEKYDGKVIQKE